MTPGFDILVSFRPSRAEGTASPRLRAVIIPFTGVGEDVQKLTAEFPQVAVHNSHFPAAATAEMAVALLLAAARRLPIADRGLHLGDWPMRGKPGVAMLLEGQTALVLGYDAIGRRVVKPETQASAPRMIRS